MACNQINQFIKTDLAILFGVSHWTNYKQFKISRSKTFSGRKEMNTTKTTKNLFAISLSDHYCFNDPIHAFGWCWDSAGQRGIDRTPSVVTPGWQVQVRPSPAMATACTVTAR